MRNTTLITFLLLSIALRAQNFEWARSFGGSGNERTKSIITDASGNLYVLGYFAETVDFDPGIGITNLTSEGSGDIFIEKLDASGNFLWAKTYGGINNDYGYSMCIDNSGNILITGYFEGTVDFNPGVGTAFLTSAGSYDVFLQKLDPSGNLLWVKSYGGPDLEYGNSISLDNSGNIYITGPFGGDNGTDFDPGLGSTLLSDNGSTDVYVLKLDPAGNFLWANSFGGIGMDVSTTIKTDMSGNIYTSGRFPGTIDFDPGTGVTNLTSAGMDDIFIQKMDTDGNLLWAKSFGGTINDDGNSLCLDPFGNVYTTGRFGLTADFDPGSGASNLTSAGNTDVFVQKLDPTGNFIWAKSIGDVSTDIGLYLCSDASGNVYTSGYFTGTVDFDPGAAGISNLTSMGSIDIFIQKLDVSGNFVWAKSIGGISNEQGSLIYVDPIGNIYTTGFFEDTVDFNPDVTGIASLTSTGAADVFVQKLSQSTAGIDEKKDNLQIKAYPNPTTGIVSVTLNQTKYNVELVLTDLQGQIIFKQNHSTLSSLDVKLPNPSGVYLLNINMSGERKVIKLVKE